MTGWLIQQARAIRPKDWTQTDTTLPTLRRFGMRRSSARTSGTALPLASRRSVGSMSGSSSAGGTIVWLLAGRDRPATVMAHVTLFRHAMELRDDTRPLTARSIVASTLLGVRPPRLPGRSLSRRPACSASPRARCAPRCPAWSRPGSWWPTTARYALAGPFLARQERQDESRSGADPAVVGRLGAGGRRGRAAVRRRPGRAAGGHAGPAPGRAARGRVAAARQPRPGPPARGPGRRRVRSACRMTGRPADVAVAGRLWDLDGWAATARSTWSAGWPTSPPRLEPTPTRWPPASSLSAAVLRHFQADPLLPRRAAARRLARRPPARGLRRTTTRPSRPPGRPLRA